ncbi:DUF2059 domain-containing protein [Pseudoroseicyclus tamaricis]|uniref:DUF2059 domain-containing protein n=1 Tax=Pseudoroseicyclus tamaricis TaxID=2705421 RepID=A0A6B2JS69_9RHOB|nr:DUF2059 domain-containing protein [Pseudoroseicyclus tamaricis]NDV01068.1 DUF2059 domain-containing protein [Pseudoroseicyclus tamaricis]
MRAIAVLSLAALPVALPAVADEAEVQALVEAMKLPGIIEVMQQEGTAYGASVGETLFPDIASGVWADAVGDIYDLEDMQQTAVANLADALEGEDVGAMLGFFTSEPGATIAELERSAREAMLEEDVEQMAREAAAIAMADETGRHQQLERFVQANDLIEGNVQGGLNGSLNFMLGLASGGGVPTMSEGDILAQVWSQEPEIRRSTRDWTYSFLTLAYEPLEDGELDAYIAFSETEPGQALNDALFSAFDAMYNDLNRELGQAAARYVVGMQL